MRQLKIAQQITKRESASLPKYLNDVSSIKLLTPEEEFEVGIKAASGDEEAIKLLIESNLRFVISVAKQYQNQGSLEELIQAGNLGLMNAARKFDPSRGFKFISYAVWWIRQSILQYTSENGKIVRIPLNKIEALNKLKTIVSKLEQELHRSPSPNEILDKLNELNETSIELSDLETLMSIGQNISSLDAPVNSDADSSTATLVDLLSGGDESEDVNHILQSEDLKITLNRILSKRLTQKECSIIIAYFGLFGNPQKTLEEIGMEHDLTRERVRQIKEKALRKLRFSSSSKLIKEYA
jgi:RNA polymerase primary sigma factor